MKKFIALVVLLCTVMISSPASAEQPFNWKFVKDVTIIIPPNPKYDKTPDQYYDREFSKAIMSGLSPNRARDLASANARKYQAEWYNEQLRNMNPQPQKLSSFYIDPNSITVEQSGEGGVAFSVLVGQVYTPLGRELYIEGFRQSGLTVPAGMEKLSVVIAKVHFKSPNGFIKYSAITDRVAYTTDGNPIQATVLSNAPINWEFLNADDHFNDVYNAAYKYL